MLPEQAERRAAEAEPLGTLVRLRVRPIVPGSSPVIRRMSPHHHLPTPMLLGSVQRLQRPLRKRQGPETPTQLSRSCGSLSAAVRPRRRAEAASTCAPTVPVEGLWRELAGVAPYLGIGGAPPALTAASHSDARQVGRQNPVKSRGNRVQTRALLDSHVDIND